LRRIPLEPRPDWRRKVQALGLVWHTTAGEPYWNEAAAYVFTRAQIRQIEQATRELYGLYIQAGDHVVERRLFARFGLPEWTWDLITDAWRSEPPALNYGRFDLGYDGVRPPKLFEFNCDTPTSLLEAAVIQWAWKEERFPQADQFNSLHDQLVEQWQAMAPRLAPGPIHFAHAADAIGEDAVTTAYLMDTARSAGLQTERLLMADIGWNGRAFVDLQNREIRTLYHLYPWEWLIREPFARHLAATADRTFWVEPIWKLIWSNKAMLPILWEIFPDHPNLLWASAEAPRRASYVQKPILAREGANVRLVRDGREIAATTGAYAASPTIWQGLYDLPDYDGLMPVIGAWSVDGEPAGMGIREDGLITGNLARFAPHIIEG
jgi:glutathionylspermidine synthase